MSEAVARDRQTLILADGRRVGFAEYGDPQGLPVLALHGAPASRLMYAAADQSARQRHLRIIAPDRPGYGLTPPDTSASLASRTSWLNAVADALNLERFAILAISGGGPYAVALAARLKERICALALVSPMGPVADYIASPEGKEHPIKFLQDRFFLHLPFRTWLTHPVGDLSAWAFRKGPDMIAGFAPKLAATPDAKILSKPDINRYLRDMTLEAFWQGGSGGTSDLEIYARPWGVRYEDVTAPAVIWQGTADAIVPPAASEWLAGRLPRCAFHSLDGAGHFWIFEHVDGVLSELCNLMASGDTGAGPVP
jgi:pimeloyl-ACP methyl ester carboxylesterase